MEAGQNYREIEAAVSDLQAREQKQWQKPTFQKLEEARATKMPLRACLHGGGGPRVGEVEK